MLGDPIRLVRRILGLEGPVGCASTIFLVATAYLTLGLAMFVVAGATGDPRWAENFFWTPGSLLLVWLAAMEFLLCDRVRRHFSPDEPLYSAWRWIGYSALFHLCGSVFSQVLGIDGGVNPLVHIPGWSDSTAYVLREIGLTIGGPLRYPVLAVGLYKALQVYRRAGFLGRLRAADWVLLAGIIAYVVREFASLAEALRGGKHPDVFEVAGWPVDPVLILLMAEALLLHRSAQQMGTGWISRCWTSFALGIFLVVLGDFGMWLTNYGYLVWPWNAVIWYIWIPAGAAFALAPAYQLETIWHARSEEPRRPPDAEAFD